MKPMNCPSGAVNWPKLPITAPVPARFQPGEKAPDSKPPLAATCVAVLCRGGGSITLGGSITKSPLAGSHVVLSLDAFVSAVSDALFTSVPVRADTRATTCPACLAPTDDHAALWGLICRLAVNV